MTTPLDQAHSYRPMTQEERWEAGMARDVHNRARVDHVHWKHGLSKPGAGVFSRNPRWPSDGDGAKGA